MKPPAKNRPGEPGRSHAKQAPKAASQPKREQPEKVVTNKVRSSGVVMPLIPAQVDVHPMLAALLACAAFLDLSDEDVVSPESAGKVLEQIGAYVHRLSDEDIDAMGADLERLEEHAKAARFPIELVEFIRDFVKNCGFALEGDEEEQDDDEAPDSE